MTLVACSSSKSSDLLIWRCPPCKRIKNIRSDSVLSLSLSLSFSLSLSLSLNRTIRGPRTPLSADPLSAERGSAERGSAEMSGFLESAVFYSFAQPRRYERVLPYRWKRFRWYYDRLLNCCLKVWPQSGPRRLGESRNSRILSILAKF